MRITTLALLGTSAMLICIPAFANIKEEYERARSCNYSEAEFISDVGVFDDVKVRFCISNDASELIYTLQDGTSWVVPFSKEYRESGILSLNTLENNELIRYQKSKGVVKRLVLGRKR